MSGFQAGTAFVEVAPSFRGFQTEVAAQARSLSALGDAIGAQISKGIRDGIGGGFTGAATESAAKGRESGDAFAGEFERQVQTKIRAALSAIPKVDITADSTDAERKIQELRQSLADLSDKRVGVDIDEATALVEIDRIKTALAELSRTAPQVSVRVDAGKAVGELDALKLSLDKLDGKQVEIKVAAETAAAEAKLEATKLKAEEAARNRELKVDADTAGAEVKLGALGAAAAAAGGGSGMGALIGAGIALGPAIIPVAGAAVAAVTAIGTAAAGAVAGAGVLFLALKPVIGAVQALSQADASSATNAVAAAAAARSKANAIASANSQVQSSEASLSNTRASVASAAVNADQRVSDAQRALGSTRASVASGEVTAAQRVTDAERALGATRDSVAAAAVTAAQRVSDAQRSLADAHQQAATGVQTALSQVASAERALAQAQAQELTAQQALTDARKSAQQQLQDYQTQLADGALSQRAALLAITRAQENLDKVNASTASTQLQRDEAKLAYDQAVQHNTDLGIQQQRLQESAKAANAAGVEGSKQVVAARTGITAANERVQTSEQALAAARAAVTAAQTKGDEQIAKAQEAVGTAQRAQAVQAGVGAAQVVKAQEAIGTAQRAQAEQARTGADQVAKAEEAITTARRAQADQARAGAAQIAAAQASLVNAQRALQTAHEQTSAAGVSGANKVAQAFKGLTPAGAEFARFLYGLKDAFTGLSGAAQDGLLPGLQEAIRGLLPALPGLTRFVGDLARVMGDLFVQASRALTGPFWTQFFDFLGGRASGWLTMFAQTFGAVVTGAAGLFQALAPVGDLLNGAILRGAQAFADWATNLGTNTGFQIFLGYIRDNLPLVLGFFGDLFRAVGNIIVALAPFGPVMLGALDGVLRFIAAIDPKVLGPVIVGIGGVVFAFSSFGPVIGAIATVLGLLLTPVGLVIAGVAVLAAGVVYAYFHFAEFRRVVDQAWAGILAATATVVEFFRAVVVPAVMGIVDAIRGLLTVALPIVQQFVGGMLARIEPLMPQVRAIFGTIGDIIVGALQFVQAVIERVTVVIAFAWRNWGQGLMDWIGVVFQAVLNIIGPALETVKSIIKLATDVVRGNWSAAWQDVKDVVSHTWETVTAIVVGALNIIRAAIYTVNDAIRNKIFEVNDAIRDRILGINEVIRSKIFEFNDAIRNKIFAVNDAIRDFLLARWADISRNATDWWSGITGGISRIWDGFLGWMRDKVTGLGTFLSARWADIQNNATAWWSGITAGISGIWDGFLRWMSEKVGGLRTFLATAWESFKTDSSRIWQGLVDGVGAIFTTIEDKVKAPIQSVLKFIRENFVGPLNAMLKAVLGEGALQIPFPPAFADGGPVGPGRVDYSGKPRGYDTGGTVFGWSPHERADNIPAMLTADEEVIRQRSARNMRRQHPGTLEYINEYGTLPGHALGGRVRGYADGGSVWDAIKTGLGVAASQTGNPVATVANAVTSNPLDAIRKMVAAIVAGIGSNPMAQFAAGALMKVGDGLAQKVKDLLTAASSAVSANSGGGAGLGAATDLGAGRVSYGGRMLDATTAGIMQRVNAAIPIRIMQGSWSTSVGASGSTHAGSGAVDFWPVNGDWRRAVDAARGFGNISWHRTPAQGPWAEHIHGITPGIPGLSSAAQAQVQNFRDGLNGLRGNGPDNNGYAHGGVVKPLLMDTGGTLPPGRSIVDNQTGGWEHLTRTDMIREGGSQSQTFNIHPSPGMDEYALAMAVSQRQMMGV